MSKPPSDLGKNIEIKFLSYTDFKEHDVGHCQYLLRYKSVTGVPLAIARTTKKFAQMWILADPRYKAIVSSIGFQCVERTCGADGKDRISNLQAMPEFAGQTLYSVQIHTPEDALAIANKLI